MAKSGVDWFPRYSSSTAVASTPTDGRSVILDEAIDNNMTSQAYGSGAIFGLRLNVAVGLGTTVGQTADSELLLMVLPNGISVPAVATDLQRKQNEKYMWAQTTPYQVYKLGDRSSATQGGLIHQFKIHLGTARRFDSGDRLVAVWLNRSGVTTTSGGLAKIQLDAYVRED